MRLYEIRDQDIKLDSIMETGSTGSTMSANIANVASPFSGIIKRMPTEPNLFGYVLPSGNKSKKKRKKQR